MHGQSKSSVCMIRNSTICILNHYESNVSAIVKFTEKKLNSVNLNLRCLTGGKIQFCLQNTQYTQLLDRWRWLCGAIDRNICYVFDKKKPKKAKKIAARLDVNSLEKYTIARATHNNQLINHIMNYIHPKKNTKRANEWAKTQDVRKKTQ